MERNIDYIKGSVYYGHVIARGRDDWEVMIKTGDVSLRGKDKHFDIMPARW